MALFINICRFSCDPVLDVSLGEAMALRVLCSCGDNFELFGDPVEGPQADVVC